MPKVRSKIVSDDRWSSEKAKSPPPTSTHPVIDQLNSTGNLVNRPLAKIFFDLYSAGFDGGLMLTRGSTKKLIFFRSGYPISAKSNIAAECLGKILTWDGIITEEQRRESLILVARTRQRQGSVLMGMGIVDHDQLAHGLQLQARFRISEAFSWSLGKYRLWPGLRPTSDATTIDITPSSLIYEGVRSFMPHKEVLKNLRSSISKYLSPNSNPLWRFQVLDVPEESQILLGMINGTTTVGELIRKSPLPIPEMSALLYTVLCTEIATTSDRPNEHRYSLLRATGKYPVSLHRSKHTSSRVYLARLVDRLRTTSPQEILGVPEDAPPPTLLQAYERRASERHPDRLGANQGEGLRELAVEALNLTAEAYTVLSKKFQNTNTGSETKGELVSNSRIAVLDLSKPKKRDVQPQDNEIDINERVRHVIEGERHYQRGLELLERGRFDEAGHVLARAVSACDAEGEFRASLAWAIFQAGLDIESALKALEHIDSAITMSCSARACIYRGHILRFLARDEEASWAFQEALRKDSSNEEALSELERLQERKKSAL